MLHMVKIQAEKLAFFFDNVILSCTCVYVWAAQYFPCGSVFNTPALYVSKYWRTGGIHILLKEKHFSSVAKVMLCSLTVDPVRSGSWVML